MLGVDVSLEQLAISSLDVAKKIQLLGWLSG